MGRRGIHAKCVSTIPYTHIIKIFENRLNSAEASPQCCYMLTSDQYSEGLGFESQ